MSNLVLVTPQELDFSVPNPRFAGIEHKADDVALYGNTLERMKESMIQTFSKTGSLLMQPVVVVKKGNVYVVRAGYTRALAFQEYYEEISIVLGIVPLLPVMVMENVGISEALTENIMRNDQNFVSLAYAVKQTLAIKGNTVSKVAKQLGLTKEKVTGLSKVSTLSDLALRLCIMGYITEDGALRLSELDAKIVDVICKKIASMELDKDDDEEEYPHNADDDEIEEYKDINDAREENIKSSEINTYNRKAINGLFDNLLNGIDINVFRDSFVDLDNVTHPPITEEPWYIKDDSMFSIGRTLDSRATFERSHKYWKSFAAENNITVIERDNINVWNYTQVEMGTHPNEIAVWSQRHGWIDFYVKSYSEDKLDKLVKDKKSAELAKVDKKIELLKAKERVAVKEMLVNLIAKNTTLDIFDCSAAIMSFISNSFMNDSELAIASKLIGKEILTPSDIITKTEDYTDAVSFFALSKLLSSSFNDKLYVQFFSDNDIDCETILAQRIADIEYMRDDLIKEARDNAEDLEEQDGKFIDFVTNLLYIYDLDSDCFLMDDLSKVSDKVIEFLSRKLELKYTNNGSVVQKRIASYVAAIYKKLRIELFPEQLFAITKIVNIVKEYARMSFEEMVINGQFEGLTINNYLRDVARALVDLRMFKTDDIVSASFDIKEIIKTAPVLADYTKAFMNSFFAIASSKTVYPIHYIYLSNKDKIKYING